MSIGTTQYPTAVDDDTTLGVPANSYTTKTLATTLGANALSGDTTLQLTSSPLTIGFPTANGVVSIEDEVISYTSYSGSGPWFLNGCTRALDGTTAVGHLSGVAVRMRYVDLFDKALKSAVEAIETTLGITGAFNFAAAAAVNKQSGTSYTFLNGDAAALVTFTNASAIAATLPQAGASSQFLAKWFMDVENRGAGTLTITPTTSTIDGAASLALTTNQGVRIFSDGSNYFTQRGIGASSSPRVLWTHATSSIVTAGNGVTVNIWSDTIAANTLQHDGDMVIIDWNVTDVVNAGGIDVYASVGGNVLGQGFPPDSAGGGSAEDATQYRLFIIRSSSTALRLALTILNPNVVVGPGTPAIYNLLADFTVASFFNASITVAIKFGPGTVAVPGITGKFALTTYYPAP